MEKIVVVAEKPSAARALAPFVRERWPEADVVLICSIPYGNFSFQYPRGKRWADYPVLSEPVYALRKFSDWQMFQVDRAGGGLEPLAPEAKESCLREADEIVFAGDPDHTGVAVFDILAIRKSGLKRDQSSPASIMRMSVEMSAP